MDASHKHSVEQMKPDPEEDLLSDSICIKYKTVKTVLLEVRRGFTHRERAEEGRRKLLGCCQCSISLYGYWLNAVREFFEMCIYRNTSLLVCYASLKSF